MFFGARSFLSAKLNKDEGENYHKLLHVAYREGLQRANVGNEELNLTFSVIKCIDKITLLA